MKKIVLMVAAVAMVACSQAASVSWTCTNVKNSEGTAISGIAFFVNDAVLSQADVAKLTSATEWQTALKGMYSYTPETAGKYTSTAVENASLGLADAEASKAYLVIFDTASITDESHFFMTEVKEFETLSGTFTQSVKWGSQSGASTADGAWGKVKTGGGEPVPEPTSALLLLLGMAGLALRRKSA